MEEELKILRSKLDCIDDQLIVLLDERLRLAEEVVVVKDQLGLTLTDSEREQQILERLGGIAKHPVLRESLPAIYREIMACSKIVRLHKGYENGPDR